MVEPSVQEEILQENVVVQESKKEVASKPSAQIVKDGQGPQANVENEEELLANRTRIAQDEILTKEFQDSIEK